jgi:signal transduction histidine kinase
VIREEVETLQQRYPNLTFQLSLGCPALHVRMRALWVRRLARHLLQNAVQAIPPDCAQRRVTVRTVRHASGAEVQVEDTGRGVETALRPLLFERPIEHEDGRSGRGLLLVRFMAEQHGGYARAVHSERGKGSCFAFGLPLAEPGSDAC